MQNDYFKWLGDRYPQLNRDAETAERVAARARLLLGHARESGMRLSGDNRVSEHDAAQLLGVHGDTLRRWRDEGNGPAYFRIGGAVSYCLQDVAAYILAGRHSSAGVRVY